LPKVVEPEPTTPKPAVTKKTPPKKKKAKKRSRKRPDSEPPPETPKPVSDTPSEKAIVVPEDEPSPAPPKMPVPEAVPAAPAARPQPPAPAPVEGPRFDAAYLNNPPPAYPPLSRRMSEEGRTMLRVQVDPSGRPSEVRIHTSSGFPRLDEAARNAVLNWRFVPATQGGEAVSAWVLVPLNFSLDQ
jgi:protein TonB